MSKIINKIVGNLSAKKAYRDNEKRAQALPAEYYEAYKNIKKYVFNTSGVLTMAPLVVLVEMFEEAAADGRQVLDITGPNVAAFADELVRGETTYFDQARQKLNSRLSNKRD